MTPMILAGDVGGTKTLLALYRHTPADGLVLVREERFVSAAYDSLETLLRQFLSTRAEQIAAAGFGLPGPVRDNEVQITNLPWHLSRASLVAATRCSRLRLMNDLEAMAYGASFLSPADLLLLRSGVPRHGNRAVIAAGTGLGQGMLFWDGRRYWPAATEGGHVDFAPRNEVEDALLHFLRRQHPRVSYERVLTGKGLTQIFQFLRTVQARTVVPHIEERLRREDPATVIGENGVSGECPTCREAVDLFLDIYGAQAGNLALSTLALGGVYVGGGIITKLLPCLASSRFLASFLDKAPHTELLADIPLQVIINPRVSLIGAARAALSLVE